MCALVPAGVWPWQVGSLPQEKNPTCIPTHLHLAGAAEAGTAAIDERNIRRRVYDALNVVMALGIIRKEKREIVWCGWPQVCSKL